MERCQMTDLIERVQALYKRTQNVDVFDESVVATLGLSFREKRVLAALLIAGGVYAEARKLVSFAREEFDKAAVSLHERGLIGKDGSLITFFKVERLLRVDPQEGKVLRRSARERVLLIMHEKPNV